MKRIGYVVALCLIGILGIVLIRANSAQATHETQCDSKYFESGSGSKLKNYPFRVAENCWIVIDAFEMRVKSRTFHRSLVAREGRFAKGEIKFRNGAAQQTNRAGLDDLICRRLENLDDRDIEVDVHVPDGSPESVEDCDDRDNSDNSKPDNSDNS